MSDLIDRQTAIDALERGAWGKEWDKTLARAMIESVPSAHSTLYGYNIEHLELIANVLRKVNLPPEKITEVLMDIGRIVAMVRDEFEETLRKVVEKCKI